MTGDVRLIIDYIFDLFLGKPYCMPLEHLEYGMSCWDTFMFVKRLKCKKKIKILKCKHLFLIFFCDPKKS